MKQEFELIPNHKNKFKPFFSSQEDYEKWKEEFYKQVKPELDRYRTARWLSEESARQRLIF